MPHCCPQKQQWVLTIRSGSTSAFHPWAGIRFSVGPNWDTNSGIVTGGLAIYLRLVVKQQQRACLVRAIFRPVPWRAICAGKRDIHPDNGLPPEADNESPASSPHPSGLQCAFLTRTAHRSASRRLAPSARLPLYKIARRSGLAAGRHERIFQMADTEA